MTIQYCSDLHLEFSQNDMFLTKNLIEPKADILILAGDIVPFAQMDYYNDFFQYVSKNFKYVYWIPGNHEYYYYDLAKKCGSFCETIRKNVFLVNNISVQHENVTFVFSTLWSKIDKVNAWQIERNMSDFHIIQYQKERFNHNHFNQLHEESVKFIGKELSKKTTEHTVVATHHVPTLMNYPPEYKGSLLNSAFAVELHDFIETSNVDYWIYGHHHRNIPEFQIGKTKLITNQLGYFQNNEHHLFDSGKTINF